MEVKNGAVKDLTIGEPAVALKATEQLARFNFSINLMLSPRQNVKIYLLT